MKHLSLCLLALTLGFTTLQAENLYVKADGTGDGSTWSSAASLADAISYALAGDVILVAKGEYRGNFSCTKGINVYGNCEGTETEPPVYTFADVSNLGSKLIGTADGKRVLYINHKDAEWVGFDISGGDASLETNRAGGGGGVYINNEGGALSYCCVHDNVGVDGTRQILASGRPVKGYGGGVYAWYGLVRYCIIENNIAAKDGWKADGGDFFSTGSGGGIVLGDYNTSLPTQKAVLENSIVRNNSSATGALAYPLDGTYQFFMPNFGGGVSLRYGDVVNCLVIGNKNTGSDNSQNQGGGIAVTESNGMPCSIINTTVAGNTNRGPGGGIGFQIQNDKSNLTIANCIVYGNHGDVRDAVFGTQSYNIRWLPEANMGNSVLNVSTTLWSEATDADVSAGNVKGNPQFTSFALAQWSGVDNELFAHHESIRANGLAGNYTLTEGSPAIDAGDEPPLTPYMALPDLAGNARTFGDAVDLGAYEYTTGNSLKPIDSDLANGRLINTRYFTLQGVEVQQPAISGIYIVKKVYESQKETVTKTFFNIK